MGGPINGMVTTLYPEPRGWAPAKDNVPVSPVGPRPLSKPKAHMVPQLILFPPRKSLYNIFIMNFVIFIFIFIFMKNKFVVQVICGEG